MMSRNILSTAGTTLITLGDIRWLKKNYRMLVAAADSVATATLGITFGGFQVLIPGSVVNIEGATDRCIWPDDLVASFIAPADGEIEVTAGGTVAGLRTNIMVLEPRESIPW